MTPPEIAPTSQAVGSGLMTAGEPDPVIEHVVSEDRKPLPVTETIV